MKSSKFFLRTIIASVLSLISWGNLQSMDFAKHSVLASGTWVKIRVQETGVCKMTYEQIKDMGFSNPKEVHVYGYGGAMLSENFGTPKTDDLKETPIYDSGSAIYFYAQGPRKWNYRGMEAKHPFDISSNIYSNYGYYFLTSNKDKRELIKEATTVESDDNEIEITNYLEHIVHKKEEHNLVESGKGWFGDKTPMNTVFSLDFNVPDIDVNELASLYLNVAARSDRDSKIFIFFNGEQFELEVPLSAREVSAMPAEKTIVWLPTQENNKLSLNYSSNNGTDHMWVEQIVLCAFRNLKLANGITYFRNPNTEEANTYKYIISGVQPNTIVWDITNPTEVTQIPTENDGNKLSFRRTPSQMEEFVAFNPTSTQFVKAENAGKVANQDLHSIKDIDFIIISHEAFLSEANRLAKIHQKYDNVSTVIVTPEEIYNEFSSGTPDASAIRWFLKMFYDRGEYNKQVLLFGDGCFDNRALLRDNSTTVNNFIVTYQGGNKFIEAKSYVSDDYFCFLNDKNNGIRIGQMKMDYGIGRFPVATLEQATHMVDKVEKYLTVNKYGKWRDKVILIADDNEEGEDASRYNKFFSYSDNIGKMLHDSAPALEIQKVYFDSYTRVSGSNGNRYPEVEEVISKSIQDGVLLLNYIGHSGELAWSEERVFTQNQAATIFNEKQGFWFTASCRFNVFDQLKTSAGEDLILNPNGGALTLFCAARTVYDAQNDNLNRMYINHVTDKDENKLPLRIGDICKLAKNDVENDTNKMSYTLIGDPMLRICYPRDSIMTDSITLIKGSRTDTIRALSEIKVYGHIEDDQANRIDNFNGIIEITLYDKEERLSTKGNIFSTEAEKEKNKHKYTDRKNILFSGKAEVKNGEFSFVFKVPKDINYNYGTGRLHYYAVDESLDRDATGYTESFIIGGSNTNDTHDDCGPDVLLYMNHKAFLSGDKVNDTPVLYAEISDPNGINSSGSGIGHDITLTINGNSNPIMLNKDFSYNIDSYSDGEITYQFTKLDPGHYNATLKVWDLLNNSSQKSIEFIVDKEATIRTNEVTIEPSIAQESALFTINHDSPLTIQSYRFVIYNKLGIIVKETPTVQERIDQNHTWEWDLKDNNGQRVLSGVYLVRVEYETEDGEYHGLTQKMIVSARK